MPEATVRLTLDDARAMVAAAMQQAQTLGVAMAVAVVDAGGHLLYSSAGTARIWVRSTWSRARPGPRSSLVGQLR